MIFNDWGYNSPLCLGLSPGNIHGITWDVETLIELAAYDASALFLYYFSVFMLHCFLTGQQ